MNHDGRIEYHDLALGCRAYLDQTRSMPAPGASLQATRSQLGAQQYANGWTWCDGPAARSALFATAIKGGLRRSGELSLRLGAQQCLDAGADADAALWESSDELVEAELDPTEYSDSANHRQTEASRAQPVQIYQSIAWSSTWRVPVLYFHVTTREGRPLTLDEITSSSLLHRRGTLDSALEAEQSLTDSGAAQNSEAPAIFPALSHGTDPLTNDACLYLHPCETADALRTLAASTPPSGAKRNSWQLAYVESFIMLCATAIEMRF